MSKSYDDRIVRMGFDNAKFESNAAKTMTTLDKLNEKLKLKGAEEGSENIQRSIDSVNFASMERAILNIERRFSTLGIVGMNVISQITNGITSSVKQLEAATIGQIKSGGWSRAMNIANAKFQIEGLGFAWEEVEKAVSYGVKDTAYGLDAAASAASQLAASGVDFKETLETVNGQDLTAMHKSLRAISGVAAMTNSSYEDIARIFTTVAGNGRLMGDQLLQLSSRGMNAAAKLAEVLGTTEEEVRNMVSRGKIDFQTFAFAMDDAFGDHAKEANKTFTGALGNMKAALSRVGEIFASPIINKTNTLFISLTERIDEFKNKLKSIKVPKSLEEIKKEYDGITLSATAYDQMLKQMGERTITFGEHFAQMWQSGIDAFSAMIKSIDLSWFDAIVVKVDNVTVKIKEFFDIIKEIYSDSAEKAADGINNATETLLVSAEEAQAAKDIILKGLYGNGQQRVDALTDLFGGGDEGAEHAKNVQAYVDSVIAAGWDFDKAAIKIKDSADVIVEAQEKTEQDAKKERIKAIIDNVTKTISNLWKTSKNLGNAALKITKPILSAFTSVFNLDLSSVLDGVSTFSDLLVNLSAKLIVSDDTAEKIKETFKKLFTIVKNGGKTLKDAGTKAWSFIQSIGNSKIIQNAKNKITELYGKFQEFSNGDFFGSIKTKIQELFSSLSLDGVGETISSFFSGITESFSGIELPKSIQDNEFIASISEFIDEMKEIIADDSDIPTKIGNLLNKIVDTIKNVDVIDTGKLALTVWGIVSIARIFFALDDIGNMIEKISAIPAKISGLIGNISTMFKNLGTAAVNASTVLVIKAAATAILEIVGSIIIISQIPADDIYRAVSVLVGIVGALAVLMKVISSTSKTGVSLKASLISLTAFAANVFAVGSLIAAIGAAIMLVASAFAVINNSMGEHGDIGFKNFAIITGALVATLAFFIILGAALKKEYVASESMLPMFFGMALVMSAFGGACFAIAAAMSAISLLPTTGFEHAIITIALIASAMVLIISMASIAKPAQMVGAAIAMLGIAGALNLLALAIASISLIPPSASTVQAVESLVGVAIVMFLGVALITRAMSGSVAKIGAIIIGVLAIQVVMSAIVGAILSLTAVAAVAPAAMEQAAKTIGLLALVVGLISALLAIGAMVSDKKGGDSDGLFAMGAAFIMVAASLYILALAVEKIAAVASGSGFMSAIIVMGVFLGLVVGLAVAATICKSFQLAMLAVGKAMLMAGGGFALVGAGVLLVALAIKILAPSIAILAINLEALFTVIQNHWPATLVILTASVIAIGLLAFAISQMAPVLTAIAQLVSSVAGKIGGVLSKGTTKLKDWVSNLSTKGKTMLVAVITTLCAAILKASPQVLETVGKLLIKLLAYLGKISGSLALGLVDFLINLINGLADAIRLNSNRIAAAIWNVVFSLVSLVLSVVNELIHMLLGDELGGLVDDLFNFNELDQNINQVILERRKIAEEADQAKKDYKDSIMGVAEASEESSNRVGDALSKMSGFLKGESDTQTSTLDSLKEEYNDLPGYAYDAILRSQQTQNLANSKSGAESANSYLNGFTSVLGGGGGSVDATDAEGLGLFNIESAATDDATTYTTTVTDGITDSDSYYSASEENIDGAQQAIEDSKEETKEKVQKNFNEPAQAVIRSGWRGMYNSAEYAVDGAISYIEDKGIDKYRSAMTAMIRAGNDAVEEINEISSPSKRYYSYAAYIVQGLVNGIEKNTDNATGAMSSLSDAIITSFGDPIGYVSKFMTGEIEYDPSIRPVFDNSGVSKGAASINSMLSKQTISVSGFSGKLAADIGTLDKSNSDVVSELQALREDMLMMQDAMENMQIVMDTGALVGSTVGAYDKALGQKQIYSKRGSF